MSLNKVFKKAARFISENKLLEFYPPFWFMQAKVVSVTSDFRKMHVRLPLKWYGKNMYGTMFGGFIAAVVDPLPALLCQRIFRGTQVWTKSLYVDFIKPGQSHLDIFVEISEADVQAIKHALQTKKKVIHPFEFYVVDKNLVKVAKVINEVYLRNKV